MFKPLFFSTDPNADFNGDGSVNFTDLGTMRVFCFLPPGPSGLVETAHGEHSAGNTATGR